MLLKSPLTQAPSSLGPQEPHKSVVGGLESCFWKPVTLTYKWTTHLRRSMQAWNLWTLQAQPSRPTTIQAEARRSPYPTPQLQPWAAKPGNRDCLGQIPHPPSLLRSVPQGSTRWRESRRLSEPPNPTQCTLGRALRPRPQKWQGS